MSFEFERTPLYREFQSVTSSKTPSQFVWSATIHIGKKDYTPFKITTIDIVQDFELNFCDEIMVTMVLTGGLYAMDIYPNKDKVEITLVRTPVGEVTSEVDPDIKIYRERFYAVMNERGNPIIEGNNHFTPTRDALDLTSLQEITFQLIPKVVQQARCIDVGGIYRQTKSGDVIKTILTSELKKISADKSVTPVGVDIVSGYNPDKREHVIIPHGTRLVDMPDYIHYHCGGIYKTGFTHYLTGKYWYVYPVYDFKRGTKTASQITFINTPSHKYPMIERTFRKNGNNIVILATGEVKFADNSESLQLSQGNGVRFADADTIINGHNTTKDNKTTVKRNKTMFEFKTTSRAKSADYAPTSPTNISATPYLEFSKLAQRNGALLSLVWENSVHTLITPGAMCKFLYINGSHVSTVKAVVLKTHTFIALRDVGLVGTRYVSRTVAVLFTEVVKK